MENPNTSDLFFLSKHIIPSFLPSLPWIVTTWIVRLSNSEVHLNYVGCNQGTASSHEM